MPDALLAEMERKMKAVLQDLEKDLATLRTGRATPALLDKIFVEYYGAMTPLNQVANVAAPDARQLLVSPWDKTASNAIVNAISKSDLGLQVTKNGDNVRVSVPSLNEERRRIGVEEEPPADRPEFADRHASHELVQQAVGDVGPTRTTA